MNSGQQKAWNFLIGDTGIATILHSPLLLLLEVGSNSYEIQVWVNALQNSGIIDMHTMHLIHHLQQHEKKVIYECIHETLR